MYIFEFKIASATPRKMVWFTDHNTQRMLQWPHSLAQPDRFFREKDLMTLP